MIGKLAVLGAVVSECLCTYVIAEWFASGFEAPIDREALAGVAYVGVGLCAFGLVRGLAWLNWPRRVAVGVIGAATYVMLAGALRLQFSDDLALWDLSWIGRLVTDPGRAFEGHSPLVVSLVLLGVLWARCLRRATDDIELEMLPRQVSGTFAVVTVVVVLSSYGDREGEIARAAATYYAVTVLTLACSQLGLSGTTFGELRAGGGAAILLGLTAGATLAGVTVFWLVFGFLAPTIGPFLGHAIEVVLFIVLFPFTWAMEQLLLFVTGGKLDFGRFAVRNFDPSPPADAEGSDTGGWQLGTVYALRALSLLVVTVVVAFAVVWLTRMRGRTTSREDPVTTEQIGGGLSGDLRSLFGRFRRHRGDGDPQPASRARRLYGEILLAGEGVGAARTPAETPAELAPRLGKALNTPVALAITDVFEESRYGGREPDEPNISALEQRWEEERPRI